MKVRSSLSLSLLDIPRLGFTLRLSETEISPEERSDCSTGQWC